MIPITDNHPVQRAPVINWILIGTCVLVFFWQLSLPREGLQTSFFLFGLIPRALIDAPFGHPQLLIPPVLSLLTSMFLHGGLLHLLGNMIYLHVFGNNVEDAMGRGRFIVFYLLCGIAAALTQILTAPYSTIPMVGASGAISGILGAYLLLHPFAQVKLLMPYFIIFFIWVPAWLILGLWFLIQLLQSVMTPSDQAGVAFAAHAGGFVAGMVLLPFFKRSRVKLFR